MKSLTKLISAAADFTINNFSLGDSLKKTEFSVVLSDDAFIRGINRDYRGFDKPTNVLSFPFINFNKGKLPANEDTKMIGEIIIAYETSFREALEQSKIFENHIAHLTVHSVMHLLGFDHMEDDEADEMEAIEIEILERMKIPNPYEE